MFYCLCQYLSHFTPNAHRPITHAENHRLGYFLVGDPFHIHAPCVEREKVEDVIFIKVHSEKVLFIAASSSKSPLRQTMGTFLFFSSSYLPQVSSFLCPQKANPRIKH